MIKVASDTGTCVNSDSGLFVVVGDVSVAFCDFTVLFVVVRVPDCVRGLVFRTVPKGALLGVVIMDDRSLVSVTGDVGVVAFGLIVILSAVG